MMPHVFRWERLVIVAACLVSLGSGCTAPLFRAQSPEPKELAQIVDVPEGKTKFIADFAGPVGTNHLKVESVALVTQLDGTGSDPPPSPMRDSLIKEMQTHLVRRPEEAFQSKNTAMVIVTGYIPPGARKGDTFDVSVRIAPRTDTTSLRNGWLMSTRLREHAVLDNSVHAGHIAGLAQGPILCDALFDKSQDSVLQVRGRVLGGGSVQLERPIGLIIRDEHTSIKTSAMIGAAINDRFHDFDRGTKRGLANPTTDTYIELKIHSRYRNNVSRFIQVVRSIAIGESQLDRLERLQDLERQLSEPTTSQRAALQLEAIGKEAIPTLQRGLASSDPEIRFYAAEALAYLDDTDASEALFEAARTERAFRWRSMLALAVMDQYSSQEALIELMNAPSAETRYGAFRALRAHNPADPLVRGEILNQGEFAYHILPSTGEPMIHVSRSKRPEIVVFGQNVKLESPSFLFAGKIVVMRHNEQSVKVKQFSTDGNDQVEICSNDVSEVVRTIAKLDGSYADVMQALTEAKAKGFLAARLEIDALPRPGRVYHRDAAEPDSEGTRSSDSEESIPEIFLDRLKNDNERLEKTSVENELDLTPPRPKERGMFDRMTAWMVE